MFAYLTDPAKFVQWMGTGAELDPKAGGTFRLDVDGEHFASGRYLEVDPPHRLVMTWGWEGNEHVKPGSTTVEINLIPDGDGTLLRLRHSGLPTEQERDTHRRGWQMYAGRLAALLT